LTKIAKYRQLIDHLSKQMEVGQKVHLVAHFDQTYDELIQLLTKANIEFEALGDQSSNSPIVLSKSDELKTRSKMLSDDYILVMAEIHPMAIREESLLKLNKNEMTVMCALDNPFFEILGGERIRRLMDKLGLNENESIEHPMVSKAIINAQRKMDKRAMREKPAPSIRDWMSVNA